MAFGDLTTLANVKEWMRAGLSPPPSYDDALLQRTITAESGNIHQWLGRFIPQADYEDLRDGTGGTRLVFANYPVVSVASLNIDGIDIPAALTVISAGYVFRETSISIRGWRFTRGEQNIVIEYRAGFAPIPPEIEQACIELVSLRYRERSRIGVVQETIVGVDSRTFANSAFSESTTTALMQYKNVAPISGFSRRLAPTSTDPALIAAAL